MDPPPFSEVIVKRTPFNSHHLHPAKIYILRLGGNVQELQQISTSMEISCVCQGKGSSTIQCPSTVMSHST